MKIGMNHHFFSFFLVLVLHFVFFFFLAHSKRSLNPRVSLQQLYGLQRSTLHITKITLKIMFLEQFTCTYTKVFRGFFISCSPIFSYLGLMLSCIAGSWHQSTSLGGSPQCPFWAHPNPLNLWEPQTVKSKEIHNTGIPRFTLLMWGHKIKTTEAKTT